MKYGTAIIIAAVAFVGSSWVGAKAADINDVNQLKYACNQYIKQVNHDTMQYGMGVIKSAEVQKNLKICQNNDKELKRLSEQRNAKRYSDDPSVDARKGMLIDYIKNNKKHFGFGGAQDQQTVDWLDAHNFTKDDVYNAQRDISIGMY